MSTTKCLLSLTLLMPTAVLGETAALAETGPLGFGSAAITRDFETDRPDFTEGAQSIEPGHLQLETGYTYVRDEAEGATFEAHSVPEALLRIGLSNAVELRVGWEGYVNERMSPNVDGADSRIEGVSDLSLGWKQMLAVDTASEVDFSYIFQLSLPTGSSETSSDEVEPELKLVFAHDLSDSAGLGMNLNLASIEGEESRIFEASASLALGLDLTEQLGTYAEYFGFYPEAGVPETDRHYVNGGFTFMLTENAQLDVRAGLGLNAAADDFFTGAGFSFRI